MTVVFSDLHLREQSEDVCFRVLDWVAEQAAQAGQHVVFCGDFWHLRYRVDVRLLNRVHEMLKVWAEMGLELDLVVGNHDQVDVDGGNALEVFEAHSHVRVWTDPGVLEDYGMGFVPYRKDHAELLEGLQAVADEKPRVIFAHFGIQGATMNSGRKDQDGIPLVPASRPPLVLGHYHKAQTGPGWQYVGSPYQTSFGEAGNVCGALVTHGDGFTFREIDVKAPRHYILEWDPSVSDVPPKNPGESYDHVRLDIKASQEQIVKGKFKGALKAHGLEDVQVNVVPVAVARDVKMTLEHGETLLHAAERFATERLDPQAGDTGSDNPDVDTVMGALKRWAQGE